MWQTATAESFHDVGLGRRTFTLEFDDDENVVVWVCRGSKTSEEYFSKSDKELFRDIRKELVADPNYTVFSRIFALVDVSSYSASDQQTKNILRIAMGGGGVGILDASLLFAWPDSIVSVESYFTDAKQIDNNFLRDSSYRNASWALTSSSLGAGLHELGHALELDHINDPDDYMSRGFDKFNRVFSVVEPSLQDSKNLRLLIRGDCSKWGKVSTAKLLQSPWIQR